MLFYFIAWQQQQTYHRIFSIHEHIATVLRIYTSSGKSAGKHCGAFFISSENRNTFTLTILSPRGFCPVPMFSVKVGIGTWESGGCTWSMSLCSVSDRRLEAVFPWTCCSYCGISRRSSQEERRCRSLQPVPQNDFVSTGHNVLIFKSCMTGELQLHKQFYKSNWFSPRTFSSSLHFTSLYCHLEANLPLKYNINPMQYIKYITIKKTNKPQT